jgi:Protein of unknown function (DUF3126)
MPQAPSIDGPAAIAMCGHAKNSWRSALKPEEIKKLDAYFKRVFMTPGIQVRALPKKNDTAEVYRDDEFLGLIYRDDEDGDLSYNFSMAILDIDL